MPIDTDSGKYRPPTVFEWLQAREDSEEAARALFEGAPESNVQRTMTGFEMPKPKPKQRKMM